MHLGSEYQVRVAAWLAVEMLAEGQGRPFSPGGRICLLRGETQESVDDLLVGSVSNRYGFIQAKRKVSFSDRANSEFTSVLDQAVRQVAAQDNDGIARPWSRLLAPSTDRLLLVTSSQSGNYINVLLRDVLSRAASLAPGQPLADAAVTDAEKRILTVTEATVRSRWQATTANPPSEDEVLSVLSLLSVGVLDVEPGGQGEREAIRTLSTVIIEDPSLEGAAWSSVLKAARKMVTERSGLDLAAVRQQLIDDGIALRATISYRRDIERLQANTAGALRSLKDLSQIILHGSPVHIERAAVRGLNEAANHDSYLVTGHPGAGKSGALHDLAEALRLKGDVVCLQADKLDIASLPALRSELGLEHELADVFANWFGSRPGYLLIDALDAARGTKAADALLELIREIAGSASRWHVIACIRKFDLRYSRDLQDLFPRGASSVVTPEFLDHDFPFVRHVNVPLLSEEELLQLESKAPDLYVLYQDASSELRKLMHVPFNLRLAATLLDDGMRREEFAPIQTQIDLLNRYWERRVIDTSGGDDRETVLRKVLLEMVAKRRLQVDRQVAVVPGLSDALDQLLSRHVLTEWQPTPTAAPDRRSLAFEHNFLFDFALSKLYLPVSDADLIKLLESDPDAVIVLRPSLSLRAQELWAKEPSKFWDTVTAFFAADKVSLLAQMTPMITVAENARAIEELAPLVDALDSASPRDASAARKALRHLVGVLKAGRTENRPFAGENAGPWCELVERITRVPKPELVGIGQALVEEALLFKSYLTPEQFANVGLAARRVFDMAWDAPRRNGQMIIHSLRTVANAFISDPKESALRIRRPLEPERVREYGYEELHWLAHEVKALIRLDAELVADMYIAAFRWTETDESATPMSHSLIVPMTSNKRQDFQQTRWHLSQHYPKLVATSPFAAARAMIAVVEAYCRDKDIETKKWGKEFRKLNKIEDPVEDAVEAPLDGDLSEEEEVHRFSVDGIELRFKEDRSGIWDGGVSSNDEAMQILGSFFQRLDELAANEATYSEASEMVVFVLKNNQRAVVWRRLLSLLAKYPNLAARFQGLASAEVLMLASETSEQFGEFIRTLHPLLLMEGRIALEERILAIAETSDPDLSDARKLRSDELLKVLENLELETEDARSRLASVHAAEAAHSQSVAAELGFRQLMPDDIERRHRGGETPEERIVRKQIEPTTMQVEQFGVAHFNSVPTLEEAENILPSMRELEALIEGHDREALPGTLRDSVIATLAGACRQIAKIQTLDSETELGKLLKKALLLAAANRYPEADPIGSEEAAPGHAAGWPIARVVATEGLLALAAGVGWSDSAILQTLNALLEDPSAKVRYPIARYALWLHKSNPLKMWEWLETLSKDKSLAVREGCVHALDHLGNLDANRALKLMDDILMATPKEVDEGKELTRYAVQALTAWYVQADVPAAKAAVERITASVTIHADQAGIIPHRIREFLTLGAIDELGDAAATRGRAVALFRNLSRSSCEAVRALLEKISQEQEPDSPSKSDGRALLSLASSIASELYFASGAHQPGRESLPAVVSRPEQTRFYWEVESVFDDLAFIGFPPLAHHLVETLEMYMDTDARAVFLRVASIVRAGKRWDYEYEQLAQEVVLRLVRRYLADKRALLQNDEDCQRALREILETFIEAGWPAAQYLAYRIDEIHR
jgi:hypothetical protein